MSLERVWSEFGESPKSQRNLCLMSFSFFWIYFFEKKGKMSLENLQTLSKLKKRFACTTFLQKKYACSHSKKELCTHIFLSLERVWRFSKLIFPFFKNIPKISENYIKQRFLCEFGVNFLQTRSKLICFHFSVFSILLFFWKRGMNLK